MAAKVKLISNSAHSIVWYNNKIKLQFDNYGHLYINEVELPYSVFDLYLHSVIIGLWPDNLSFRASLEDWAIAWYVYLRYILNLEGRFLKANSRTTQLTALQLKNPSNHSKITETPNSQFPLKWRKFLEGFLCWWYHLTAIDNKVSQMQALLTACRGGL